MKKVVIISSTPRKGGNSEILAEEFARGAADAGNAVEIIQLRKLKYGFCSGCLYCQSRGTCALKDGIDDALLSKVQNADVLAFATPIYYYSVSGQLKTFLDRCNPLYTKGNRFREVYLLASAADGDQSAIDGAIKDIQGWIDCFDGVEFSGVIKGVGAQNVGDIKATSVLRKAYETGRDV